MTDLLSAAALDEILGTQLMVAWAGEARSEPKRLAWWDTDLFDRAGGGDLLARLLPSTGAWASLDALRGMAARVDLARRREQARSDEMISLFHFGFHIDEQLDERLAQLKTSGNPPSTAIPALAECTAPFEATRLAERLQKLAPETEFKIVPGGRQLKGKVPSAPALAAKRLAAALVPFAPQYPLPFFFRDSK